MTLRLYASDPLFADWNTLMTLYAQLVNAHLFVDLQWFRILPEPEWIAFMAGYKAELREVYEEMTR